jgi:hypothetical protein
MIGINLSGGLGNQMFQIATAYAHAKDNNDVAVFNLSECYTPNQGNTALKYDNNLFSKLNKTNNKTFYKNSYNELNHFYDKISYENNQILNGYFQSYKYFDNYKEEIINLFDFSFIEQEVKKYINSLKENNINTKIVTIHIRRGDFINFNHVHNILDKSYYDNTVNYLEKHIKDNLKYVIISDDINWCKSNFINDKFIYLDSKDELFDLCLIKDADHNINANSSFSWWGSFLNNKEESIKIYPNKWFQENTVQYKLEDKVNLTNKNNIIIYEN